MTKQKTKKPSNHIHLYKKVDLVPKWKVINNPDKFQPFVVFACQKPACTHWIRHNLAIGKLCECNRCHNPMVLDKETVKLTKPHCQDCIIRKSKIHIDKLTELLKEI